MADRYLVDKLPSIVLLEDETVHKRITGAIDINTIAKYLKGEKENGCIDN